ncbi:MAG: acetyl-CoA C-acetyltransferase [Deltaproteobacteria bacterium]|nr:acetyl-CoA C-acetyltransferase [Deltaproteobacteria bacterium]
MRNQNEIVILSGIRTPFGKFGGSFKNISATDLGVIASRAVLDIAKVAPEEIDHVVFGNAQQTSADAIYLARHIGLKAGIPKSVPALTVNRICGSGFQSIITAAQYLLLGEANFVLAGGTENMSQAPHVIRGARWGIPLGQGGLEDSLWSALNDTYCDLSMALTAENLARRYGITREASDRFAYQSQMRATAAQDSGRMSEEIVAVGTGSGVLDRDEHPRSKTTLEGLAALKPVFKKDGVVTAGNASGICDGAAAVVVTTAAKAKDRGLTPMARILSWGIVGCDPEVMGIGPAPAIRLALQKAGLSLNQMDLIEVNEAFAAQYLAVEKDLGLDREKVNVNGGAIALGHPLGASGTRITVTLLCELKRRRARYGIGSACIGGGQGIALLVENISTY